MHIPPNAGTNHTLLSPEKLQTLYNTATLVNAISKNRARLPFIVPILYVTAAHCSVLPVSRAGGGGAGLASVPCPEEERVWNQGARNTHFGSAVGCRTGTVCTPPGDLRGPNDTVGGHRDKVLLHNSQRSSLTRSLQTSRGISPKHPCG